jgi:hypothetical protein
MSAIVAMPDGVTLGDAGLVGCVFTTQAVAIWHADMNIAPAIKSFRRPMRSERTKTKKPQAMTLMAPKMPVRRRSLEPPPTRSLKY